MRPWFWLWLLAGVVGSQIYLWVTILPLGIPGEWTWNRVQSEPDFAWNMAGVAVAVVLYVAFVETGARRFGRVTPSPIRRLEVSAWLAGLIAVSFVWLWVVQEMAPTKNRLGKSAFVLYYASSSGYFTKARYETPNAGQLLSGYEALMSERDVLHVGTHPPGLFLVFHALIEVCRQSPALSAILDATQPESFSEACDIIARNSLKSAPPRSLLPADRRVLWLATLIVLATASLAIIPLFGLILRTSDRATAWRGTALWPAVPAVALFAPKSDVAFAFLGLLMVYAWLTAVDRRSTLLALATGLLAWCGLMMSLALLPVFLFMAIVSWQSRALSPIVLAGNGSRLTAGLPPIRCVVGAIVGFLVPILVMGWICHINMISVWMLNYQNHAAFYSEYTRTYWKWLLENPIELAFAAGVPVVLLAGGLIWNEVRSRRLQETSVALGVTIVWGALWLTGKNSGEAARLWIVFLPWLVWLAGLQMAEIDLKGTRRWFRPSVALLTLQLVVGALTVARVSGFQL